MKPHIEVTSESTTL